MKVIDLTQFIEEGMPVYPGTEPPLLAEANTIPRDGFREKLITMYSHTGTHMDAPAHIFEGAPALDELPMETFFGKGFLVDLSRHSGKRIERTDLEKHEMPIGEADFLLLRTGWDRYWGEDAYFSGYPVLSKEAAEWLAGKGLKGIGLDAISADPAEDRELPVHRQLLGSGMVIIENLTKLESLPEQGFFFSCFPLKIRDADGSPVRGAALIL